MHPLHSKHTRFKCVPCTHASHVQLDKNRRDDDKQANKRVVAEEACRKLQQLQEVASLQGGYDGTSRVGWELGMRRDFIAWGL